VNLMYFKFEPLSVSSVIDDCSSMVVDNDTSNTSRYAIERVANKATAAAGVVVGRLVRHFTVERFELLRVLSGAVLRRHYRMSIAMSFDNINDRDNNVRRVE
jgi:hypothetical protein